MLSKRPSWKEIIDKRSKDDFVGRADYLRLFSDNFATEVPAFLLFFVIGEGGVGKSTLLKQYEAIDIGPCVEAVFITCDDEQLSPGAAMGHISEKLASHGIRSKEFDERYNTYRTRREEIEADPKAPRGALNLVLRGMTDFAIKAARRTPGVGVFAEYVDEKDAGEALAQGVNYLIDRYTNKDEVELLREPERILTPLFIELLNKACEKHRLVLMFDVFERTREALEPWLLEFLSFEFGEFDTHLTFVISGRDSPDQRWTQIASSVCHIILEPFTLEETRIYLGHRGITDEQLVTQIHEDTGGLPVLVELLAGTNPKPGLQLPDISKDAVKRFLQWITEDDRRRVALSASVPRQFNVDILSAALGGDAATSFSWLSVQSYIRTSLSRGWFYHEKVRELMLRHLRNTTPSVLSAAHTRLAQFFETQQNQLGHAGKAAYESETWRKLESERVYHSLCAQPERNIGMAINAFLIAFRWRWGYAENIAHVCDQAAHETEVRELLDCSVILNHICTAYDQGNYERLSSAAVELSKRNDLIPAALSEAYAFMGYSHLMLRKFDLALADFDRAVALDEKHAWALANRGLTYQQMDQYAEALADFDRAVALDEKNASTLASRGLTYRQMGKYAEALADFDRAVALDEKNASIVANRGVTYRRMGKYAEALADFDRAVALDEKYARALAQRGETYRLMGQYAEALVDLDLAIALDEKYAWALAHRGETYRRMGQYAEALADFDRAIVLDEKYAWALASRGETYRRMGQYAEALADFDRVVALDENNASMLARRGETYRQMDQYAEALADFDRAVALDEKDASMLARRGETYRQMDQYAEALADFDRAIALDEKYAWALASRGETYRQMGQCAEALANFDRAIALDEKNAWALASRGETYRQMGQCAEALADFDRAVALDEKNASMLASRGVTYRQMGQYAEALADFDRAVALDEKDAWALARRGETYQQMGKYAEALADFDRAVKLDSQDHWAYEQRGLVLRSLERYDEALDSLTRAEQIDPTCTACVASRGETYRQMGKYPEALADFDRAIVLDEKYAWALASRGETYRQMGKYSEALADFDRIVELDPKSDWAQWRLGVAYGNIGEYQMAIVKLDRAITLNGKNARAFASRGEAYGRQGDFGKALSDFDYAIALDEKLDYALAYRGDFHRRLHNYDAAIRDLSLAIELDPTQNIFECSRRAAVYQALGDLTAADADIARVMEAPPRVASDFYSKAVVCVLSGNHAEAVKFLRGAINRDASARIEAQCDDLLQSLGNLPEFREVMGLS